jgi:hypothetical protein
MISAKEMSDNWSIENILNVGLKLFNKKCKLGNKFCFKTQMLKHGLHIVICMLQNTKICQCTYYVKYDMPHLLIILLLHNYLCMWISHFEEHPQGHQG